MRFKVVIQFDSPNTEAEIRTAFENIEQDIIDRGNDKLGSAIDSLTIEIISLDVTNLSGNTWEIYPKIIINGDWDAPPNTINNRFDDYIQSLRGIFQPVVNNLGGSGTGVWHLHNVISITNGQVIQGSTDEVL